MSKPYAPYTLRTFEIPETITEAAINFNGDVYSVPKPGRHHDVIAKHRAVVGSYYMSEVDIQGFITSTNRFVNRKQAALIAYAAKQIESPKRTGPQDELFSEDLW